MRVLVTGARGMLGFALQQSRPAGVDLLATDLPELDITREAVVERALREHAPAVVLNLAAYTDVDRCEAEPERAHAVNAGGAERLARSCAARGVPLLHVSTDYVFDGRIPAPGVYAEEDATGPLSAYGRSKLAGEVAVRGAQPAHWIVRTQWLFGQAGKNFVETMLRLGPERRRLSVVDDQVGSPTSTHDLAPILWAIVARRPAFGTYHAVSAGSCSWFEFARAIFALAGLPVQVDPIDSATLARPAPRPARSVLSTAKLRAALGLALPSWKDGLTRYLERRAAVEGGRTT